MSSTIVLMLCIVVYIVLAVVSYRFYWMKKDNSMFEKVWFSILWILCIPLMIIHWIHNGSDAKF